MNTWTIPARWFYQPIRTILLSEGICPRHQVWLIPTYPGSPPDYCPRCQGLWLLERIVHDDLIDIIHMQFNTATVTGRLSNSGCSWRSDDLEKLTDLTKGTLHAAILGLEPDSL